MPKTANALADELEGIWAAAERAGRSLTADERQYMSGLVEEAKAQNELEQQIKAISGGGGPSFVRTDPNYSPTGGGPGEVFVQSKGWKSIADPANRGQNWTTGRSRSRTC